MTKVQTVSNEELDVTDVILHTGAIPYKDGKLVWPTHTRRKISIAPDLWIGPRNDREAIMDACEPRGENTLKAIRQFPCHYAFFRTNPPNKGKRHGFDPDLRLRTAIQLSRIVRPTTTAYAYAARIIRGRGMRREIVAPRVGGPGYSAYVLDESRNCLWDENVTELRAIIEAFRPRRLPRRVRRALWHHEFTAWTHLVDLRLPQCVNGLEAFVHTDERSKGKKGMGSTRQFISRMTMLKQFVPGLTWTERDLEDAYDHRSRLVHGLGGGRAILTKRGLKVFLALEGGYREILKKCILTPVVAQIFSSETSIRTTLGF
jgi:hypothetical protein